LVAVEEGTVDHFGPKVTALVFASLPPLPIFLQVVVHPLYGAHLRICRIWFGFPWVKPGKKRFFLKKKRTPASAASGSAFHGWNLAQKLNKGEKR